MENATYRTRVFLVIFLSVDIIKPIKADRDIAIRIFISHPLVFVIRHSKYINSFTHTLTAVKIRLSKVPIEQESCNNYRRFNSESIAIHDVSKKFGNWYQKTNKTKDTNIFFIALQNSRHPLQHTLYNVRSSYGNFLGILRNRRTAATRSLMALT